MMSCKEVTEAATDYLDGNLPFWRKMALRMHVAMCRHCRAFLDQLRKTVALLGQLPQAPVAQETRAELVRQFRERNKPGARGGS
jgi:anti-sigma factor RsiW